MILPQQLSVPSLAEGAKKKIRTRYAKYRCVPQIASPEVRQINYITNVNKSIVKVSLCPMIIKDVFLAASFLTISKNIKKNTREARLAIVSPYLKQY